METLFELEDQAAQAGVMNKGHGRLERREVRTWEGLVGYTNFPGLAQAAQIKKRVVFLKTREVTEGAHYLITSLGAASANPHQILPRCRNHWEIEKRLFHVKEDSFGEDRHVMGCHQSATVISLLRAAAISPLRGRSVLWTDKEPLTGRAQAVHATPSDIIR